MYIKSLVNNYIELDDIVIDVVDIEALDLNFTGLDLVRATLKYKDQEIKISHEFKGDEIYITKDSELFNNYLLKTFIEDNNINIDDFIEQLVNCLVDIVEDFDEKRLDLALSYADMFNVKLTRNGVVWTVTDVITHDYLYEFDTLQEAYEYIKSLQKF